MKRRDFITDSFEAASKAATGEIDEDEITNMEMTACPGEGACQGPPRAKSALIAFLNAFSFIISSGLISSLMTVKEICKAAENYDEDIIRPVDNPYHKEGGIAVLRGNIAPAIASS